MPPVVSRSLSPLLLVTWLALLAGVIGMPYVTGSPTLGEDLIRYTVRLSLAYYAGTVGIMLLFEASDWQAGTNRGRLARWLWTLAWATFVIHLFMAFHFYHNWSHAHAVEHTRQRSGWGEGIYVSHLFTLLWTCDVAWWWRRPLAYERRPVWIDRLLHGFMLFIVFNGTVVYETGLIRWAGLIGFAVLAAEWAALRLRSEPSSTALSQS